MISKSFFKNIHFLSDEFIYIEALCLFLFNSKKGDVDNEEILIKKTISNEVIFNVIGIVGVILLVPIFITFVFWYLDTNVLQQVDENFLNTFVSHSKENINYQCKFICIGILLRSDFFQNGKTKKDGYACKSVLVYC